LVLTDLSKEPKNARVDDTSNAIKFEGGKLVLLQAKGRWRSFTTHYISSFDISKIL
jgi:hypothetical protein